jgi:hypothetical protein
MNSNKTVKLTLTQILVRKITTVILPEEMGRYVTLETLSSLRPDVFHGIEEAHFRDLKGVEVRGKIVNMKEEMAAGHFPAPPPGLLILDTRPAVQSTRVRRMAQGGIQQSKGAVRH